MQVDAVVQAEPFAGASLTGYEIHNGQTQADGQPFCVLSDGSPEGCVSGNVFGTYVHGVFDTEEMQHEIRDFLAERKGVRPETYENGETFSMAKYKEEQYDKMAKIIRENLDMDMIYRILERKDVR